ncbi:MAG: hypothetical protein [phage Lak_Megaphage_RVC_AP4_GC26]|uniref:Uncharacterized protein n=1 Tax=phage Lak_Megaphage_RVC_AP3_GC26 TaxID=3109225 RepID=A0ABZ0Z0T7_9CAUD|nr:MAG: hypothetical protein [phage Lak_Megaphage_RVC_AP3_GC26]WQJ52636.1 MAG: hypothetical protein [phage Lak_Megaphage_RVC_AP4_GC26]
MDSYDRLIGKTLFEMKFNYYDNALREYSKDNIWFQSYNQLKYGIEDTCQYSYLKKCKQNYLYEGLLHTMDPNKALSKLKNILMVLFIMLELIIIHYRKIKHHYYIFIYIVMIMMMNIIKMY